MNTLYYDSIFIKYCLRKIILIIHLLIHIIYNRLLIHIIYNRLLIDRFPTDGE